MQYCVDCERRSSRSAWQFGPDADQSQSAWTSDATRSHRGLGSGVWDLWDLKHRRPLFDGPLGPAIRLCTQTRTAAHELNLLTQIDALFIRRQRLCRRRRRPPFPCNYAVVHDRFDGGSLNQEITQVRCIGLASAQPRPGPGPGPGQPSSLTIKV